MIHKVIAVALIIASITNTVSTIHASVKNSSGIYCIILDAEIAGSVAYHDTFKNTTAHYDFSVDDIDSEGKCHALDKKTNRSIETLKIQFLPTNITTPHPAKKRWLIELTFGESNAEKESFKIIDYKLVAVLYNDTFNVTTEESIYEKSSTEDLEWAGSYNNGFTCSAAKLSLTNDSFIKFSKLKVIAFAMLENATFPGTQLFEQCKIDVRTSDLIPIVVGVCLAGLVVIVLVAYLIGRYRAMRQGYESV